MITKAASLTREDWKYLDTLGLDPVHPELDDSENWKTFQPDIHEWEV